MDALVTNKILLNSNTFEMCKMMNFNMTFRFFLELILIIEFGVCKNNEARRRVPLNCSPVQTVLFRAVSNMCACKKGIM
jgi:hypothetical protein